VRYDNFNSYPAFFWLTNTKQPSLHLPQLPGTSWMRSPEMRFSTRGEERLQHQGLLLHHTQLFPLRPCASQSKLSSSHVVPTVQPSNMVSNTPSGGESTRNWCHRIENTSLFTWWWFYLWQRGFPPGSWRYAQSMVRSIVQKMGALLWYPCQEGINTFQAVQIDLQMLL